MIRVSESKNKKARNEIQLSFKPHPAIKNIDVKKYSNLFVGYEFEFANNDKDKLCTCKSSDGDVCEYCNTVENNGFWLDRKYASDMAKKFNVKYDGHNKTNGLLKTMKKVKRLIPFSYYEKIRTDTELQKPNKEIVPIQNVNRYVTFDIEENKNLYKERQLVTDFYTDGSMPYEVVTIPISTNDLLRVKTEVFDVVMDSSKYIDMYLFGKGGLHMTYLVNSPHMEESIFDDDVLTNLKNFSIYFYPNLIELFRDDRKPTTRKLRYRCIPFAYTCNYTEKYECFNYRRQKIKTYRKAKSSQEKIYMERDIHNKLISTDAEMLDIEKQIQTICNEYDLCSNRQSNLPRTDNPLQEEVMMIIKEKEKLNKSFSELSKKKDERIEKLKDDAIKHCENEKYMYEYNDEKFWAVEVRIPDGTNDWELVELQTKFYSALIRQIALFTKYGFFDYDKNTINGFNDLIYTKYIEHHVHDFKAWSNSPHHNQNNTTLMIELLKPSLEHYGIYDDMVAILNQKKKQSSTLINEDINDVADYIRMKCKGLKHSTVMKQITPKVMKKNKLCEVLR